MPVDVLVMALRFALLGCVVKVLQLKHNKIQPKDSFSALHFSADRRATTAE
jgi:hypothetical protein